MNKQILTVEEVAQFLKVSKRTIYRLISAGHIEAFKVGGSLRVKSQIINDFIERQIDTFQYENGVL